MTAKLEFGSINAFDSTSVGSHWRCWKRSSNFFLEVKGITKDSQRKALLLHCPGQDVQYIFDTLADPRPVPDHDTEYVKAMRSLDAHDLFALAAAMETWADHLSLLLMVIPRYGKLSTCSNSTPHKTYFLWGGVVLMGK